MNKDEQRKIVVDMCNGLRDKMLYALEHAPSTFDGNELREMLFEFAEGYRSRSMEDRRSKRVRDFRWWLATHNL